MKTTNKTNRACPGKPAMPKEIRRLRIVGRLALAAAFALWTGLMGTARANTVSDDFSSSHDYLTAGVSGTIWDGIYNQSAANVLNTTGTAGELTIGTPSSAVGWDGTHANAPYLYKNVAGDFDARVKVTAGTTANFTIAGLLVRLNSASTDGNPGEDFVLASYNWFNGVNQLRSVNDNVQTDSGDYGAMQYLRLTRTGNVFRGYTSSDGSTWTPRAWTDTTYDLTRADLASTVQVGLTECAFVSGNVTWVRFDNFSLITPSTSKLAVASVNGGSNPTSGIPFSVEVQAQDSSHAPANVVADTVVTLTRKNGTGTLGGTTTGTISAGNSSVTISGVTYTKAESGVTLTAATTPPPPIDSETLAKWSVPYRNWYYQPHHVISSTPNIPGYESFQGTDVPTVYQLPGDTGKWYMSFIAFNGKGYNSFVAESTNLVNWSSPRLAMGFGQPGAFDYGGCVVGAYLYESYDIKAPRLLKQRDGKYWTLYGAYPFQTGYESRPGYEGVASSADGLTWQQAKSTPILSVYDPACGTWEQSCIYMPWLVENNGTNYNFYNAANGDIEQMGIATATDLLNWTRYPGNPVVKNGNSSYDAGFASDGKVFRDGDHWTMFYFGVGAGGAHIMAAFSYDLMNWKASTIPLYLAGGNPSGLDSSYAHKISLVYNPGNDTYYMYYCAVGNAGRGIGLITSKPIPSN